ncbi:SdpI family protein [Paenibacillus koleovorans]|uniref:SdpI family protein n=1 Tax=Paenibacillus koleovorans TaxID=121608 RepID=UPI000FDBD310|nr:SdpI family protein [Paenibacillus koleovorans]
MKKSVWVALILWLAAVGLSIWSYGDLPEQVPSHWGPGGEVDDYSSKEFAVLFIPGLMVGLFLLIRVLPKIDPRKSNYPKFQGSLHVTMNAVLLMLLAVHGTVLATGLGYDIPIKMVIFAMLGLMFMALGNVMPRFKHNYMVGIRTPWTLADEKVWTRTHLVGGKIFMVGGALLLVGAFLPLAEQVLVMLVLIAAIPVSTVLLSFYYFKRG